MNKQRSVILVVASFTAPGELFNWFKKYAQESDERFAYWDDFAFTTSALPSALPSYDGVLVLNSPHAKISVTTDPGKIIAFMMEPGVRNEHPWMFKKTSQYAKVFSPLQQSHGYLGWYGQHDYSFYKNLPVPNKTKSISCIVSSLKQLPGHRLRLNFMNQLRKEIPGLNVFGKGINYIGDKLEGLLPYRYSVAIENSSIPYYFTEKINDCFLAYSVPLYYGCTNIDKFFPSKSYIAIDINSPVNRIRDIIENDDWSSRLDALKEARELVLNKYQPLAGSADIFRNIPASPQQKITLQPVRRSFFDRIRRRIQ